MSPSRDEASRQEAGELGRGEEGSRERCSWQTPAPPTPSLLDHLPASEARLEVAVSLPPCP